MKRVMIVGQPGAGKSTLARDIGDVTGLPVVHVDLIHWKAGWEERGMGEKIALAHQAEAGDAWVFQGGLSRTYDNRLNRADTLIVLNLSTGLRMWRVFLRTLKYYGRTRPDLPDGCPERFNWEFWKWIWDTRHKNRIRILLLAEQARGMGKTVHVLQSASEVRNFLTGLESGAKTGQYPRHGNA